VRQGRQHIVKGSGDTLGRLEVGIIDQLILVANRPAALLEDKVFQTAIGARREPPFPGELGGRK
jgi:hypothetical protein